MVSRIGSCFINESSNKSKHGSIVTKKIGNVNKSDGTPRRKRTALFLCFSILFNNIFIPLAQAKIVPHGYNGAKNEQTVEEDEKDSLSIINIAPPNENGISYNSFESFVLQSGKKNKVLINNSRSTKYNESKEIIQKSNPRLGNDEASTIVFEVDDKEDMNLNDSIIEVLGGKNVSMIFASPRGIKTSGTTIKGTASKLELIAGSMRDKNKLKFDIGENGNMVFSSDSSSNLSLSAPDVKEVVLVGRTMQFTGEMSSREKITIDSRVGIDLSEGAKFKTDSLDIHGNSVKMVKTNIDVKNLKIKSYRNIDIEDKSTIYAENILMTTVRGLFQVNGGSVVKANSDLDATVAGEFKIAGESTIESDGKLKVTADSFTNSGKSTLYSVGDMELSMEDDLAKPIEWLLATNDNLTSFEDVHRMVGYYSKSAFILHR
ncbi:hypothetical protein FACS1894152_6150 [Bacilli bacterium]|nr:hypothetical protein FACS1894152_6150 [Bacilli bacterium]